MWELGRIKGIKNLEKLLSIMVTVVSNAMNLQIVSIGLIVRPKKKHRLIGFFIWIGVIIYLHGDLCLSSMLSLSVMSMIFLSIYF